MQSRPMISVAGIRGIVGDSLLPETFLQYVLAFGTLCEGGDVVVGGDTRISRHFMRNLVFAGLSSTGCAVHDLGLVPTPTIGLMVRELGAAGGIGITASHNPSEWNALKFFGPDGSFLDQNANKLLLSLCDSGKFRRADFRSLGKVVSRNDALERHVSKVLAVVDTSKVAERRLRVVVDCVNGVGALIAPLLLDRLGCETLLVDADVNSEFPRNPEPLPENLGKLAAEVLSAKADIGFAIDPDADRLAIVDEKGRPIGEERTLVLASDALLGTLGAKSAGMALVANLSTSRAMDDVATKHNATLHRTPIGEAHVVGKIRSSEAIIGGEGNGGVIYPAVHPGRDAATGMALILSAMAREKATISELNSRIPDYVMVKTKAPLEGLDLAALKDRMNQEFRDAVELVTEDGVKAVFPESWVHLRGSGTEPIVRIFAEGRTAEEAAELISRVKERVMKSA